MVQIPIIREIQAGADWAMLTMVPDSSARALRLSMMATASASTP